MFRFDSDLQALNLLIESNEEDRALSAFTLLFLLAGLNAATYGIANFVKLTNRLDYENPYARLIAGFLLLMTRILHARSDGEVAACECVHAPSLYP